MEIPTVKDTILNNNQINEELRSKISSYASLLGRMTQRMEVYKSEILHLQEENKKVNNNIQQIKNEITEKDEELNFNSKSTITTLRSSILKYDEESTALRILDDERNIQFQKLEEQLKENSSFKSKYILTSTKLDEKSKEYNILIEEKRKMELAILGRNRELSQTNKQIKELNELNDKLNYEINILIEKRNITKNEHMIEKEKLINHLTTSETELKKKLEIEYKSDHEKKNNDILEKLYLQINKLKDSLNEYKTKHENLSCENKNLSKENENQSSNIECLSTKNNELRIQNRAVKRMSMKEKEDMLNEIRRLKERQTSLEQENIIIKQESDVLDKEIHAAISFLENKDDFIDTKENLNHSNILNDLPTETNYKKIRKIETVHFYEAKKNQIILKNTSDNPIDLNKWIIEGKNNFLLRLKCTNDELLMPQKTMFIADNDVIEIISCSGSNHSVYYHHHIALEEGERIILRNLEGEIQDKISVSKL